MVISMEIFKQLKRFLFRHIVLLTNKGENMERGLYYEVLQSSLQSCGPQSCELLLFSLPFLYKTKMNISAKGN